MSVQGHRCNHLQQLHERSALPGAPNGERRHLSFDIHQFHLKEEFGVGWNPGGRC